MYEITEVLGIQNIKPIATVATIADAEAFLAQNFNLITFDRDDENDGADALVTYKAGGAAILFAINAR